MPVEAPFPRRILRRPETAMTHQSLHIRRPLGLFTLALMFVAGIAAAQQPPATTGMREPAMGKMDSSMKHSDSMHTMPATVDSVDHTTGVTEVTTEGMKLKLHFPPASLATVKKGDSITLHLGFTK
jgi:hypothetical protein